MSSTTASKTLPHASITLHPSTTRGHSDHGWLNSYHSFSFASWHHPSFTSFGSLRVLNEDRVAANSGFPTHTHHDFEIFSYILSGELTHRDSMLSAAPGEKESDRFRRLHRGGVQFTTGGTGIAHSEQNEHETETVHFLQIWAMPWKMGLTARYHTGHFSDEEKRLGFVTILSPLRAGPDASPEEEEAAVPVVPGTIPIHADFVMGAALVAPGSDPKSWTVGGGDGVTTAEQRKVFVHVPMTKEGEAKVRLDAGGSVVLGEGDGAFVEGVRAGDRLLVRSVGKAEAELVVLDTA